MNIVKLDDKKNYKTLIMSVFQVRIPDELHMNQFDVAMLIASKLYEDGKLSSGQAAEIVGLSKRTFLEILGKYNVSIFGYSIDELESDLENA